MCLQLRVLICGQDAALLETRQLVLEYAGFGVMITLLLDEAKMIIATNRIELLVLCHTLSRKDQAEIINLINLGRGHVRVLRLVTQDPAIEEQSDLSTRCFPGPRSLISAVATLLNATPPRL